VADARRGTKASVLDLEQHRVRTRVDGFFHPTAHLLRAREPTAAPDGALVGNEAYAGDPRDREVARVQNNHNDPSAGEAEPIGLLSLAAYRLGGCTDNHCGHQRDATCNAD